MIYRQFYNPSQRTIETAIGYILRSDTTVSVSRRMVSFHGARGSLEKARDIAHALAPLAAEYGTPHARPRTRPWRHSVLTLPQNEDLTDNQMLDITVEATRKICAVKGKEPDMPMITAVHRDTDNLHSHIVSVPVDISTMARVRAPRSVMAYRSVLQPIETRLGLSSPKAVGRWDGKRFHLPFVTWTRMNPERLKDVRHALLKSGTWEECMRALKVHGIKFRETSANFSASTRYFLAPYGSRRLDEGMAIQRDVFAGCKPAPSASDIVRGWGRFPKDYQEQLEQEAVPGMGYRVTAIGGKKGQELYRRWQGYAAHKRTQRENLKNLVREALQAARDKPDSARTDNERRLVADPRNTKAEIMDGAAPMRFADWVESMADRRDPDAQWLCGIAADGANVDPAAALAAEKEGSAAKDGNGMDERERVIVSAQKVAQEQMAMAKARAARAKKVEDERRARMAVPRTRTIAQVNQRRLPLASRGAILETLL